MSTKPLYLRINDANAAITLLEKGPEKNSGFERDSNPPPLRYPCNALPTELSKPHESGRVWVRPFMFSQRNTRLKYMNFMVVGVLLYCI